MRMPVLLGPMLLGMCYSVIVGVVNIVVIINIITTDAIIFTL